MNIPVDHRIVSLKFEQYLRDQHTLAMLIPRIPEQFTKDDETYLAGYTCEVQLSNNPKDLITFVMEFSDDHVLFCRLDDKGSLEPIFKSNFYSNTTTNGQLQNKFLEHYIKLLHEKFKGHLSLLK